MSQIGIIMGSDSDYKIMEEALQIPEPRPAPLDTVPQPPRSPKYSQIN